ncbi:unnamed protein product [Echinostoma caproni]|uniref:Doublecortin domain-containing protein n=1 Tax=Echinostoma caproni TaxID=27848 RepID=A0A183BFV9_9TREM|nr:unnamed protein product [Echinostoma caproni]
MFKGSVNPSRLRIKVAGEEVLEKQLPGQPYTFADHKDCNKRSKMAEDTSKDQHASYGSAPFSAPVNSLVFSEPVCIFCGMGSKVKFGQGDLARFHTLEEVSDPPAWFNDLRKSLLEKQERAQINFQGTRPLHGSRRGHHGITQIASWSPLLTDGSNLFVGPHLSLDGARRIKEQKSLR